MNEIEKLYENAGVYDFRYACDVSFTDGEFGRITNCSKGEVKDYCTDKKYFKSAKVINYKRLYPPFTAEKQLNLTKLIGLKYGLKFIINEGMDYMLSTDLYNNDNFDKQGYGYGFDEAIANLINNLWQSLTSKEKEQIRGILNG